MKQQTAVEWLEEHIKKVNWIDKKLSERMDIIQQAKEMEKDQMLQCYEDGYNRVAKLLEDAAKQNGLNLNL